MLSLYHYVEQGGRDLPRMLMMKEAYLGSKNLGKVKTSDHVCERLKDLIICENAFRRPLDRTIVSLMVVVLSLMATI